MDGTVTKILKDVSNYLSKYLDKEAARILLDRVNFAIEVNTEIDTLIDKAKELSKN
ncbi:MAG: hypothetical protein V1901_04270 [Patescibacteria group bacterium]